MTKFNPFRGFMSVAMSEFQGFSVPLGTVGFTFRT